MTSLEIQPATEMRGAFARWARVQEPRINTSGPFTSLVPADQFGSIPSELLVGALVDGQPWVVPVMVETQPKTADVPEEQPVTRRRASRAQKE